MARADVAIADIEGQGTVGDIGGGVYGGQASVGYHGSFGAGTVGRKEAYIALGVAAFLLIYWKAAKGY
jgi:hypothetical protein